MHNNHEVIDGIRRGKALGGSSAVGVVSVDPDKILANLLASQINHMAFYRASKIEYDRNYCC